MPHLYSLLDCKSQQSLRQLRTGWASGEGAGIFFHPQGYSYSVPDNLLGSEDKAMHKTGKILGIYSMDREPQDQVNAVCS